jgi:hypothetical protein
MNDLLERTMEIVRALDIDWKLTNVKDRAELFKIAITTKQAEDQDRIATALTTIVERGIDLRVTGSASSVELPIRHTPS